MSKSAAKKPEMHLYPDGSASWKDRRKPKLGAGIVAAFQGKVILADSFEVVWDQWNDPALKAEIASTARALSLAPRGYLVKVYSDCNEVRDYINSIPYRQAISAGSKSMLAMFVPLANAIKKHGNENVEAPEETNSERFSRAANALAVKATGSSKWVYVTDFQGLVDEANANKHLLQRAYA